MSSCYHCGLSNPQESNFCYEVFDESRRFCCPGCLAVAKLICESGQSDFYRFRSDTNAKVDQILPEELLEFEAYDNEKIASSLVDVDGDLQQISLGIEGITCAACGWLLKKQVSQLENVKKIEVNTSTKRAQVWLKKGSGLSEIFKKIRELGYKAFPYSEDEEEAVAEKEDRAFVRRLIVAGLAMMQVMMFATGLYIGDFQDIATSHAFFLHSVSGLLATPVVFYSALPFIKSAISGLKFGHLGMNVPVSIAILSAYFASLYSLLTNGSVFYFDSVVMFTFFLLLGRYLEHHVRFKALLKQQTFRKLLPLSITRKNKNQELEVIPVSDIKQGDILVIAAGTVVPVDGKLISERASLDEAVLSGESLPVNKLKNDSVYSGSTNANASFEMKATSQLKNSRLQRLISLQNEAENLKSHRVTLADKIANWYVIILLGLSVIVGYVWYQIDPQQVFPILLSLLVVSCPCALSLATPAAFASAIARLTDKGIMIKSSNTLSNLSEVDRVVFDKTGTLTDGKFQISKTILLSDVGETQCFKLAKSLESISNHPLSNAFKNMDAELIELQSLNEQISEGIEGVIGEDIYRIGKYLYVTGGEKSSTKISSNDEQLTTSVFLSKNNALIAEFVLTDQLNSSAVKTIESLRQSDIETEMLSGDNQLACSSIAAQLSLDKFIFSATPEQKLAEIEKLNANGHKTLMVGDGINDIGAFSAASVSITMGNASHLSKTNSDAVLVSRNLSVIPFAINLSKRLDITIKQNLIWAASYNLLAIPFAILGLVPAWAAAIGMTSSSIIVVLNALRLRK